MTYFNLTYFLPLSLSYLIMYFLNVKNDFHLIRAAFHQEVVFDRQDEKDLWISSACVYTCARVCVLRVCSLHPLWLLGILTSVWQSNLSTTAAWWILTQYAGSERRLRQTERKEGTTKWYIFLTRRWTQQPGFITNTNKSMNESRQTLIGSGTREAWLVPQSTDVNTSWNYWTVSLFFLESYHLL